MPVEALSNTLVSPGPARHRPPKGYMYQDEGQTLQRGFMWGGDYRSVERTRKTAALTRLVQYQYTSRGPPSEFEAFVRLNAELKYFRIPMEFGSCWLRGETGKTVRRSTTIWRMVCFLRGSVLGVRVVMKFSTVNHTLRSDFRGEEAKNRRRDVRTSSHLRILASRIGIAIACA